VGAAQAARDNSIETVSNIAITFFMAVLLLI